MIFKAKKKSGMIPTVNIVVFGAGGVGKTSLIRRYMYNSFEETYNPTIEDAFRKVINCNGLLHDLTIIDMAGSYQFPAMRRHAIEHANGFLLVYATDDPLSVEEVKRLYNEIREVRRSKDAPIVFVCNKIDKSTSGNNKTNSSLTELIDNAGEYTRTAETSAKLNLNVGNVFAQVLELICEQNQAKNNDGKPQSLMMRKNSRSRRKTWWKAIKKCVRVN